MAVTEAQSRMVVIGSWGEDRETGRCWQGAGASSCNVQESRGRCAACSPAHGRAELSRSSSPVVLPFLPDPCCQMSTFLLVKVDPFRGFIRGFLNGVLPVIRSAALSILLFSPRACFFYPNSYTLC